MVRQTSVRDEASLVQPFTLVVLRRVGRGNQVEVIESSDPTLKQLGKVFRNEAACLKAVSGTANASAAPYITFVYESPMQSVPNSRNFSA